MPVEGVGVNAKANVLGGLLGVGERIAEPLVTAAPRGRVPPPKTRLQTPDEEEMLTPFYFLFKKS